ncbi:MAG: sigma-70 family RNA polymerase sigma factor [Alphaproteobacteria bacterium]
MSKDLHDDIVRCLPQLRALALLLARDRSLADDLVQEAVARVLRHADQFQAGTNFKAWIMAILRNSYFSEMRRRSRAWHHHREMPWVGEATSGGQEERIEMRDLERAFMTLPAAQREALVLVGANGFSYEAAAELAGCAVGTMKSRVSRARLQLERMLNGDGALAAREAAAAGLARRESAHESALELPN